MKFTKEHEWIKVEGDEGLVGITDYAAKQLGDVVFVDLPSVGKVVTQHGDMAVVESVKAASDVYAPVSGTVIAVNNGLPSAPQLVNEDPHGQGWFVRLKFSSPSELTDLMDESGYKAFLASL